MHLGGRGSAVCNVQTVVFVLGFVLTVVIRVHVFKVDVFSHDLSSRVSWCDIHVRQSHTVSYSPPRPPFLVLLLGWHPTVSKLRILHAAHED